MQGKCNLDFFSFCLPSLQFYIASSRIWVLIYLPDFIQITSELLYYGLRTQQLDALAEAQEPAEELVAYIYFRRNGEMPFILCEISGSRCAEAVYHSVQKRIYEAHFDALGLPNMEKARLV